MTIDRGLYRLGQYTIGRITGGWAVLRGSDRRLSDACRIVPTRQDAEKWVAARHDSREET